MGRVLRAEQFDPSQVCIVHTVQRCVRRAFLAGVDQKTGIDYSFRKQWIARRMEGLASVFGVDVLGYAIMSNHLHLVLRSRPDVVACWSDEEVALRWLRVFPGRRLDEQLAQPTEQDVQALAGDAQRLAKIRLRLSDISWFMRALSEPIARLANRQDECTGRFWEGRFKAQRIADEAGLLACAMYVDLNPVRAALADTPERSPHTSAWDRIQAEKGATIASAAQQLAPMSQEAAQQEITQRSLDERRRLRANRRRGSGRRVRRDAWLAPVRMTPGVLSSDAQLHGDGLRASDKGFLSLSWRDYLSLLRWTAAQRTVGGVARVPKHLGQLLGRLGIEPSMWRDLVWNFKRYFGNSTCLGSPKSLATAAQQTGKHWHRGQRKAQPCFTT